MKAWAVTDRNGDEGVTIVVFAETRGKALSYAVQDDSFCDYGYTELRALRCKSLDAYYKGRKKMDWFDDQDRILMAKAGFSCGPNFDCIEGKDCPAYEWCERGGAF